MSLLALLPEGPPARLLALALNAALCAGILSRSGLEPLRGKTVSLEISDLGVRVRLALGPNGFRAHHGRGQTDLTVRASALDYAALAFRREDPDTLFFTRRLVMTGDTELGLVVKNALDAIDWSRLPRALRAP
ncbi:MAG TPA: SCP2 sterol-binding domain-containing protein [Burkholderiales bacterium]|nr:SCP2 sterol-binding domain-containing protein [Burkholderiales bacterium]